MVWIIKTLEVFSQQTSGSEACGWQFALSTYSRNFNHRDQRADCCAARAFGRPFTRSTMPVPLRKAARSSRVAMDLPQQRRASVCGSAAALRSDSVPAVSPSMLHCFRSPTADRSRLLICPAPSGAVRLIAPTIRACGQAAEPTSHQPMLRARASFERGAAERNAPRTIERRGQCCPNFQERRRILRKTDT